ncbi:MAG: lasso peptide biosynthesis B2 protein [Actinobacteria bacterium]|jgi:hypothetical protein|nr:MAG: lasso peptide biosynthesis B2 protein [Actinomycetota bacterium]
MKEVQQSWLLEMWKIKLGSCREALRLYARSGLALLRALLSPAAEMRRLEKRLSERQRSSEDIVLNRTGKWFALLDRLRLRPSCLTRSLALARVLREEGHDAHLVFGVRSDNGDMEGHCWVAVDGRPITEAPEDYRELRYG